MKGRVESWFYLSVGVGMAIATSSFTMVSTLFSTANALWVLFGVALAGAFCMVIALSVGELASMFPSAPGVRTYFKVAFGNRTSLTLVYLYLIFVIIIAGLESFVFSQVVLAVFPRSFPVVTIVALIGLVVLTNLVGFDLPRSVQILTTILAVVLIVISGMVGLLNAKLSLATNLSAGGTQHQVMMLPALAGMSVFLYAGFEWVTPLGLRPKAYERKIPFSMPLTVLVLFLTYGFFVVGAASQMNPPALAATPTPQIPYFQNVYGPSGLYLALALSVFAIFSTFNAGILGGSQLIFMLAQERNLPAWCAAISLRTGSPIGAVLLLGGLATAAGIAVLTFRIEILAALVSASIVCSIYAAFMLAVITLRKDKPDTKRPFRTPVPSAIQWMIAAVLLAMAIQTLFSEPGLGFRSCFGALICLGLALTLAKGSSVMSSSNREPLRRPSL